MPCHVDDTTLPSPTKQTAVVGTRITVPQPAKLAADRSLVVLNGHAIDKMA